MLLRLLATILLLFFGFMSEAQQVYKRQATLMGSVFEIILIEKDSSQASFYFNQVISEIERIENLISEWRPHTQVSEVNHNAGIQPVKVDTELFELTKRAIAYSEQSTGAFDISITALDKIWKFDGTMDTLPSESAIQKSIENIGYKNILLDSTNSTIFLQKKGMKIGFGSIGKGYAADKGRELLQSLGVVGGIVNASGDLSSWGTQPNGKPWAVGVSNPFKSHKIIKTLKLRYGSVATSGSYEKYAEINGNRYSHIINPKTGYPATGLTSVTITGPSAEIANALSTSVMVLGEKEGRNFLKRYLNYRYILVTDKGRVIKN